MLIVREIIYRQQNISIIVKLCLGKWYLAFFPRSACNHRILNCENDHYLYNSYLGTNKKKNRAD